jgi:energy-converting hydrogenase Eha subunit E
LDNPYVTIVGLALVIYSYNKNATLSILIAIALVMTLHVVSKYRMLENMAYPYDSHDHVSQDHYSPAE